MKELRINALRYELQINNLNIGNYIININKFPLINIYDEYKIIKYFRRTLDIKAANILIITHLRFVVRISKYYIKYGLYLNDIIQEGSIGLIKSIRKYDLEKKTRLVTFSVHWIKSEIHNYILKNWKIVKTITTKRQRNLFFGFKQKKIAHNIFLAKENTKLLNNLCTKISNIDNMHDIQVDDTKISNSQDLTDFLLHNKLKKKNNAKIKEAIMSLDKRSREIIYKRYLSKSIINYTLANLSLIFGISRERIRQIEKLAISKIKKKIL